MDVPILIEFEDQFSKKILEKLVTYIFLIYIWQKIKELDAKILNEAKFNQLRALKNAKDLLKLYDQVK